VPLRFEGGKGSLGGLLPAARTPAAVIGVIVGGA
jgi:hypothetical protein